MATETGVIESIAADRSSATIIKDSDLKTIETNEVSSTLALEDGVEFEDNGGKAEKVKEITKVSIKGALTTEETRMLQALVMSVNGRGGDGGIQINIKTKK